MKKSLAAVSSLKHKTLMTSAVEATEWRVSSIPARAGIGLRAQHYRDVIETRPDIGWFEVHSENYFGGGGKPHYYLEKIRCDYPLSLHGVGLSIGSADPLNYQHLQKLKNLIQRYQPGLVSEHLSWGSIGGRYMNDLLPLPYIEDALQHMVDRVSEVQDYLGCQILIENVSSYLQFSSPTITEWDFLSQLSQRAGCGILLDINNIYVNAFNHGFDAYEYVQSIPVTSVQEMHLAGHTVNRCKDTEIIIDSHDAMVRDEVWNLYREAVQRFEDVPVLIEWDSNIPALNVLLDEAGRADHIKREQASGYIAKAAN